MKKGWVLKNVEYSTYPLKCGKKHKLCCDAYKSLRDERMISFIPPQAPVASAKEWSSCILEKKIMIISLT